MPRTRANAPQSPAVEVELRRIEDGFKLLNNGCLIASLTWDRVTGIAAFNHATLTVDYVSLWIARESERAPIVINEGMSGWSAVTGEICSRFGIQPDWDHEVSWLAGRLNWLRLWGAADSPDGRCWKCHYDLTGNTSGTCPECGQKFVRDAKLLDE